MRKDALDLHAPLQGMCRALVHRGPDDEGSIIRPNWALGHRRLSIIDLSSNARQPFINEAQNCFLAVNGEIYNFQELRDGLLRKGHRFVSSSDCEVVLHLLEEEGEASIQKLNGMFAFAFVDEHRHQLLLCRDRLGIKPLYYRQTPRGLDFASEIKALYAGVTDCPEVSSEDLLGYFQYRYVSGASTLFKGVKEILPGHFLAVDLETLVIQDHAYWVPEIRFSTGEQADEQAVGRQLEQSVASHLVSDVPLGCQLSGGLDSSLVTAMAMGMVKAPMHTFSVGFAGYEKDESSWAAQVGRYLGTIHHPVPYTEQEFLGDLAFCTYLHDEPLNHPNSLPMYKLCREARKQVTVLLTGEGADELFGGYSWHRRLWRLGRFGRVMQWPLTGWMARTFGTNRLGRMLPLLGKSPRVMAVQAGKWVPDEWIKEMLEPDSNRGWTTSWSSVDWLFLDPFRHQLPINEHDPLAAVLDMDLKTYLVSVLQRQDRMSMASGVESRVPFLDHELVEQVLRIPVYQHFEEGRGKAVLRHIARGRIPDEILDRPKTGFSLPLAEWMRNPHGLGGLLAWLTDERAMGRQIWRGDVIRARVIEHQQATHNHADLLWPLLAFEIWARIWLDGTRHEQLSEEILHTMK